ncbi:MAG: SMP-30/gluconolactonase/LRE family protein [Candidatus Aminicenantes bacterium]|nr:SMP-30/gluconolactonase/LRE family protein [Candidatus Aminicenantes bacterium]
MKGKKFMVFAGILFLVFSLSAEKYSVKKVWETPQVLKVPESVLYDPGTNAIYVSNINGNPGVEDKNGFISKISTEGKILALKWATGLGAPKGMAIFKGKLYVSDVKSLVCIDLSTGKILRRVPAPGAQFLNDVAVDENGNVYVSDSSGKNSVVYRFSGGKIETWLKDPEIKNPNGLFYSGGKLYVGASGKIFAVDVKTRKMKVVANVGHGIDGLILDKAGFFIISDWRGKTELVTKDGKIHLLLDTTANKINAADLGYIPEKRIILVPTFFDNRVVAYSLNM